MSSSDPISILSDRFRAAIRAAFPQLTADIDPLIAPSKQAQFGDFQCNAAMSLAKQLASKPRDVAQAIVKHADLGDLAEKLSDASIAGPGFINIKLRGDSLGSLLASMDAPSLGVEPAREPMTVVVDLMGVNLAKQMHVGHLRSPFIGDAVARTFERLGHTVLRQNHLGDWGLNIAMTVARLIEMRDAGTLNLDSITLDQLDAAYKAAESSTRRDVDGLAAARKSGHPKAIAELEAQVDGATDAFTRARQTLVKLQAHDPDTFGVWQRIREVTMSVCLAVCERLRVNVTDEHSAGESSYAEELAPMVADLEKRAVAEVDQGALIVRVDQPPRDAAGNPAWEPIKEPCLVRKTDGGFLYATTDVCAIRRRVQKLLADRIIYCIDARQNLHLRQVFAASVRAGYATNPRTGRTAVMEHAAFGAVLGEDGRPFKTRSGDSVSLQALIDEAVDRAAAAVRARNTTISDSELRATAETIGVAAMKYADLCNDRSRDYMFSFDRMLAFEGNTGPYLLYAYARIRRIFEKARERGVEGSWSSAAFRIAAPSEKTLALALLPYNAAVARVAETLQPHHLCQYLYDLAGTFSTFYDQCPVVDAPDAATRDSRLRLCDLTGRVLRDGLSVLGIPTLERM